MIQTGVRVSGVTGLLIRDLHLGTSAHIRVTTGRFQYRGERFVLSYRVSKARAVKFLAGV